MTIDSYGNSNYLLIFFIKIFIIRVCFLHGIDSVSECPPSSWSFYDAPKGHMAGESNLVKYISPT